MWGGSFFGRRYYGLRYFGVGFGAVVEEAVTLLMRRVMRSTRNAMVRDNWT